MQYYVKGEEPTNDYGFSSSDSSDIDLYVEDSDGNHVSASSAEQPLSEKMETNQEKTRQGDILPVPTVEQRRLSAPSSDWDPVR